jgi:hypothetical protein
MAYIIHYLYMLEAGIRRQDFRNRRRVVLLGHLLQAAGETAAIHCSAQLLRQCGEQRYGLLLVRRVLLQRDTSGEVPSIAHEELAAVLLTR